MQTIRSIWNNSDCLSRLYYCLAWGGVVLSFIGVFISNELSPAETPLAKIGVGLTLFGIAITASALLIGRQIDKLNKTESNAREQKILALEVTTRPIPIRERLIAQLNAINPQILTDLKRGETVFNMNMPAHHFRDLQRIASEKDAEAYISFRGTGANLLGTNAEVSSAAFSLRPSLLEP